MTTDADSSLLAKLRQGPAFLFLGQAYLKLQAADDALLALILKKYGSAPAGNPSYNDLLLGSAGNSAEAALAWIEERCRLISVPNWLEMVATFAWSGIYSSAMDSVWLRAFRTDWRELQSILEEKYRPRDPRNKSILHCTHLFGCVNRTDTGERPPLNKSEWRSRRQVAIALTRRLPELLTPRGMLAIEGYRGPDDWLSLDDLLPTIEALEPGQVHIFSCEEGLRSDTDLSVLAAKGHIYFHDESLAQVLNRFTQAGALRLGAPDQTNEEGHQITLNSGALTVPRELWQNISRLATVLDDASIGPQPAISEDALYREFREALAKTDSRPNWSAYVRRLLFTRDFEAGLVAETLRRLNARDLSDSPLILHGQTSTGKTIAMGRLAYVIREAAEFPVVFVGRKAQKPGFAEIEQFCHWLESRGVRSSLWVWDGMLDPDEYIRAARYFTSKGRKVVVVGTCYRLHIKQRSSGYIEAPEQLSSQESVSFRSYLHRFHPELATMLGTAPSELASSFLATLYRLLPPTLSSIRLGVTKELGSAEDLILKRALVSTPEPAFPSALANALFKAGIVAPAEFLSATAGSLSEDAFSNLQVLTGLIMVPGQFGIRVPVELLMRALEYRHGVHLADLLQDVDIFQWYEDSVGNVEIGPRNPLEARLIVQARLGGPQSEVRFAKRLLTDIRENALSADREVDFAVELLSAMRGKRDVGSPYAPYFTKLADTLRELREQRGCENPRLMLQEANLLRKSVITGRDDDVQSDTRNDSLDRAESVLQAALDRIGDDPRRRDLKASLLVELGSVLGTRTSALVQIPDDRFRAVTCFRTMRDVLRSARLLSQNSYYPIDVLAWATQNLLKGSSLTETERVEVIADLMYAFETAPKDEFDPEQLENFERRRMDFGEYTKQAEVEEEAFQALVAQGSSAGYFLRALHLSEPNRSAPDAGAWDEISLRRGLSYLEAHRAQIDGDSRCLDLLLDLWWMTKAKARLFRGERISPPFSSSDWQYLLELVDRLLVLAQSSRPLVLSYLRGLSLFHTRQFDRAFEVFRELERESDAVWGKRRIIRSYLASSEAGLPLPFHGDVHWLSPDSLRGEVYVTELMRPVKFFVREFPKQDIRKGLSLGEFHIGFNFLGPIADPKVYPKGR